MGDLQQLNDATAAGFAAVGDTLRRPLTEVTANYVVTPDDRNTTLLVNDGAGMITITLPTIGESDTTDPALWPEGHNLWVQIARINGLAQGAGLKRTFINCAAGDRFGTDEPTFTISGVSNNGLGLKRVSIQEQRLFTIANGFANVVITGAGGGANGTWPANRPLDESIGFTSIDLVGSVYTGTAGAGGVARFIRTQLSLQYSTSYVKLTAWIDSNGVGRWVFKGTLDISGRSDMAFGDNTASSPMGYYGYYPSPGNRLPLVDFAYSGAGLKFQSRSATLIEFDDPPELGFGRYTGATGVGAYPDGPDYVSATSGLVLGTLWWMPSVALNSLIGRCTQIYTRTTEVPTTSQRGAELVFDTTDPGTNTLVTRLRLREQVSVGPRQGAGFFEATDASTTMPVLRVLNTNTAPAVVGKIISAASGNNARSLLTLESANATDIEFRFSETGNGLCDGSWTGGGADYAEIFEWWDGNTAGEDRAGRSVVLVTGETWDDVLVPGARRKFDAYRIRLADSLGIEDSANIFGAVSSNPNIKGGGGELRWNKKFATDAMGRVQIEEAEHVAWVSYLIREEGKVGDQTATFTTEPTHVGYFLDRMPDDAHIPAAKNETLSQAIDRAAQEFAEIRHRELTGQVVTDADREKMRSLKEWTWVSGPVHTMATRRIINPDFDPALDYEPRSQRPEWDYVGLLGQIPLLAGQPVNPNWFYIGDVAAGVELWLVR